MYWLPSHLSRHPSHHAIDYPKAAGAFNHIVNVVFQVPDEGLLYKVLEKSGENDIRKMVLLSDVWILIV